MARDHTARLDALYAALDRAIAEDCIVEFELEGERVRYNAEAIQRLIDTYEAKQSQASGTGTGFRPVRWVPPC